jgi:murein DD-endopeptidase MepM/ murein hydrolase activator NlpD
LTSMLAPPQGITTMPSLAVPQPKAAQQPDVVVVQQGDCLSRICSERLKEQGRAGSPWEIYAAVKEVAKANHIADPDKIFPGQRLDLSLWVPSTQGGGNPDPLTIPERGEPWKSLVQKTATLSSGFGLRMDPFTGQVHQHNGIDVAAPAGAPIHALAAGQVIFSGWKPGYGNTVIIRHEDGLESLYGHASKLLVHVGEWVAGHAPIGSVGSTGRSTGAHLHFEVRRDGQALNPDTVLNENGLQVALT